MKKLFYPVLFLILAVSFQSCSSNDDDGNSGSNLDNEVTINGTTYSLNNAGFIFPYGSTGNDSFDWDVVVFGSEIEVYLDLNTTSANGLVEGTYTFSNNREAFTFYDAEVGFYNSESYYTLNEDTVINITINGNNVSIEFSGVSSEDGIQTTINVEWSGSLTVDNSDD